MSRAVSPVVASVLLLAVTVALAATVATAALGMMPSSPAVGMDVSAHVEGDRLALLHHAGPPIDVRSLSLRVRIDGEALTHQPPVPFFAAEGFQAGPTGPFNAAADPTWTAGERASVTMASTNEPDIDPGDLVRVRIVRDGRTLARVTARA